MTLIIRPLLLGMMLIALTACGLKGPLTLPAPVPVPAPTEAGK